MNPGWWNPRPYSANSKWHYIDVDGVSLCGKWAWLAGDTDNTRHDHLDNCKACMRKFQWCAKKTTPETPS